MNVSRQGLLKKQVLTAAEVQEIEQLAGICNAYENLHMRIDWIKTRTYANKVTNDFLYFENGTLVGYLVLDNYGTTEKELTGMVHPHQRRKGIFTALLTAAREECVPQGVRKFILICEDASRSGQAFVAALGTQHDSSEHRMVLETFHESMLFDDRLFFREATDNDINALITINADGSDDTEEEVRSYVIETLNEPNCDTYIATLGEASVGCKEPIGCLRLYELAEEIGIYGFVVRPAYRRRGYGRQMLEETIHIIQANSQKQIMLEVDTDNSGAINLYRSCGFKVETTYGYYNLDII